MVRLVTAIHSGGDCLDRIYALVKSCGAVGIASYRLPFTLDQTLIHTGTEKNHANVRLRAGLRDAREDIDEEGEGRRTNVSPNTPCQTGRRESQISQREAATSRLLSFVVKLSRSSKVGLMFFDCLCVNDCDAAKYPVALPGHRFCFAVGEMGVGVCSTCR